MRRNATDLYTLTEGVISRLHRKSRLWTETVYFYAGQCACVPILVYCVILCTIIAYFINIDKKKRKKGFCAMYYFIIIHKEDEGQGSGVRFQTSGVKSWVKGLKSSVKGQRSGSGLALGLGLQTYPRRNLGSKWVSWICFNL